MERFRQFFKSQFLRDGVTLISGNVWAQGIAFAAYFILTRLFSPEDFGLYNVFYSYIEVLIIISTCKYELAIVLGDNDKEAMAVSSLAFRLNGFFSLALLIIVTLLCIFSPFQESGRFAFFSFHNSAFLIPFLIPAMVYLCGTSRIYSLLLNRLRQFRQIALSEVIGSSSGVLFRLFFGLPAFLSTLLHTIGLPLGVLLGRLVGNINLRIRFKKFVSLQKVDRQERRRVASKFRNFPLYTMPKEFVNSLSYNLPFLWLSLYFDRAEIGLFALALTFTLRPVNVLNSAFERLLYVRIAERVREHSPIKSDLFHFVGLLNLVALPLFVVAFFFADNIFAFLFGGRWSGCGIYFRYLLPWAYIILTSTSLMFLTNVFSRQRAEFFFYSALFVLRVVAMVVGLYTGSFKTAILLFSLSGAFVSLLIFFWLMHLVNRYEEKECC